MVVNPKMSKITTNSNIIIRVGNIYFLPQDTFKINLSVHDKNAQSLKGRGLGDK